MKKKSSLNTCNEEIILKKSKKPFKKSTTKNSQLLEYFNDISVQTQLTPPPLLSLIKPIVCDDKYEEIFDFKDSLSELSLEHKLNILNDVVLDNVGFEFELNLNKSEEKINCEEVRDDGCGGDNFVLSKDLDLNILNLKKENIDFVENSYFQREREEEDLLFESDNLETKDKKLREKLDKKMLTSMRRQMRQQKREEKTTVSKKHYRKTKYSNEEKKNLEQISSSSSLTSDLDIFFDLNLFRKNTKIRHKKMSITKTKSSLGESLFLNNSDLNDLNHLNHVNENEMFFNINTNDINFNEQTNDFDFDVQNFQINFDAL